MDPALDGYISLEEEATISPPQCVDSPNAKEACQAKPATDEAAPPEADTAEMVEAGVPEEPCFYGYGPAWDGVDGNLAIHRVCRQKGAQLVIRSNCLPLLQLHKWHVNYKNLFESLVTKSFAKR